MHGKPRNDALWAAVARRYPLLDEVKVINREGTTWNVKAIVPGAPADSTRREPGAGHVGRAGG